MNIHPDVLLGHETAKNETFWQIKKAICTYDDGFLNQQSIRIIFQHLKGIYAIYFYQLKFIFDYSNPSKAIFKPLKYFWTYFWTH